MVVKSRKYCKSRKVVFVFIICLKFALFTEFALTPQTEFVASGSFEFSHVALSLKTLPNPVI